MNNNTLKIYAMTSIKDGDKVLPILQHLKEQHSADYYCYWEDDTIQTTPINSQTQNGYYGARTNHTGSDVKLCFLSTSTMSDPCVLLELLMSQFSEGKKSQWYPFS